MCRLRWLPPLRRIHMGNLGPSTSPKCFLARRHIRLNLHAATITLLSSKTDPFASGSDIQLTQRPNSPLCPVTALHSLLRMHPSSPDDPAFSRTVRAFSKPYFIAKVREYLLRAGLPTLGRAIPYGKAPQSPLWQKACLRKTSNALGDGKAMLLTSTSTIPFPPPWPPASSLPSPASPLWARRA